MREKVSWFNEIPPTVFFVLSASGAFYFYGGDYVLYRMNNFWEAVAFIVFIFSIGITIVNLVKFFWRSFRNLLIERDNKNYFKNVLIELDPHERNLLSQFYVQRRSTLSFPFDDPVVQGLVDKRVLINASSINGAFIVGIGGTTYRINSYLKKIIDPEKHLNLTRVNMQS